LLLLLCGGCVRLRPWQRETLAKPIMMPAVDPYADGQDESMREIIEGATFGGAGPGSAGAGCGCH
jgi:hypothetical protein